LDRIDGADFVRFSEGRRGRPGWPAKELFEKSGRNQPVPPGFVGMGILSDPSLDRSTRSLSDRDRTGLLHPNRNAAVQSGRRTL
jgi:hypothetical protein